MAKHWKPIALILAFVLMQLAGRLTSVIADVAVCGALYWLLTKYFGTSTPKEGEK